MTTLPAFAKSYANVVNGLLVRFLIKNRFILIIQSLQMMYDYKLRLIIESHLACQWVVVRQTIKLTQTIPFIPDDDVLTKYCKAIKDELQKSKTFDVGEVYFKGYTYLKEV